MAEQGSAKRQVAYKVSVADIMGNRYVREDGWLPNYVSVRDMKVSRANILGVIVSVDRGESVQSFILDDGTGRIAMRFFESPKPLIVGDIVTVIGRPREFGDDRYIVPEIVKKISDNGWVKVRKAELALDKHVAAREAKTAPPAQVEEVVDDIDESSPISRVLDAIRSNDSGAGVDFDEISVRSGVDSADEHIQRLLEQGDIFEVKPGRYKVLE